MPQTDAYEYVATSPIHVGGVVAYQPGDPVPADNVTEHGYLEAGLVVPRGEYVPAEGENTFATAGVAQARGDMPPHIQPAADADQAAQGQEEKPQRPRRTKAADAGDQ